MEILVLGGGDSPEREVSLRSAKAVAEAARQAGFNVREADPRDDKAALENLSDSTMVFPILHGVGGEDGIIQLELEKRNLSFLGSGSESSRQCFDKWTTRRILMANAVKMPKAVRVTKDTYAKEALSKQPHVLKILHGGSSIGTLIVRDPVVVGINKIYEVFELETVAVLEEYVEGTEITIPVLDHEALPALEVHPPEGQEFDYKNKYNGQSQELCPPPSLSPEQHKTVQELAQKVHTLMGCRHLSRVDTIMRPSGEFVVLEINTMPGLTEQSLYPKSAEVAGIPMPALVKEFVRLVQRDYSI